MTDQNSPAIETPLLAEEVVELLLEFGSISYKQIIHWTETNFLLTDYDLTVTPGCDLPRYKHRVYSLLPTLRLTLGGTVERMQGGYRLVT
jgi:hypothetical protein